MSVWLNPRDTDAEEWRGDDGDGGPARLIPTIEWALTVDLPYERSETIVVHDASGEDDGAGDEASDGPAYGSYESVRLEFEYGVAANGEISLGVIGWLWNGAEPDRRFRARYRREGSPTETEPFGRYDARERWQTGTVVRARKRSVSFTASGDPREEVTVRRWEEIEKPTRLRLAEAELVRSPEFARYVLRERGVWTELTGER
jgi:hypothetical protein